MNCYFRNNLYLYCKEYLNLSLNITGSIITTLFITYDKYSESKFRIAIANRLPCKYQNRVAYRLPAGLAHQTTEIIAFL